MAIELSFNKGNGHSKIYLNTRVLEAIADLAFDADDIDMYDKMIEMSVNQGVNTCHINFRNDMAIFMHDHGYNHGMGTDLLAKFFSYINQLRK